MNAFLSPLVLGAFLLSPNLQAQEDASSQVDLRILAIDDVALAGQSVQVTFELANHSSQTVDKVVAIPTGPAGQWMNTRNLHTRDVLAGASLVKQSRHDVPDGSSPGTYQVRVQALAADGTVLRSIDTSFDVVNFSRPLDANGLHLEVSDMPAQISAGQPVTGRVSFTNHSDRSVLRVFALVQAPNGRLLSARGIAQNVVVPGAAFDRAFHERTLEATRPGTYRVQFQALCDDGTLVATTPATFEVTAPAAGLRSSEPLSAFPNPAADRATLRFDMVADAEGSLSIYDALGRLVSVPVQGVVGAGRTEAEVDVSGFAPGLYVARLTVADEPTQVTRFTVAR